MKKEYHINLKNSSTIIVYADSFDIYDYSFHTTNFKRVRFVDKKQSPIMSIAEYSIDEIYHYKSLFSDDRIIDYVALPFPDSNMYVDLS